MDKLRTIFERIGDDLAVATYGRADERLGVANKLADTAVNRTLAAVDITAIVDGVVAEISGDGQNRTQGVLVADVARMAIQRFSEAALNQNQNSTQGEQ